MDNILIYLVGYLMYFVMLVVVILLVDACVTASSRRLVAQHRWHTRADCQYLGFRQALTFALVFMVISVIASELTNLLIEHIF